MPRNTSVTLGDHFDQFVVEKIKSQLLVNPAWMSHLER